MSYMYSDKTIGKQKESRHVVYPSFIPPQLLQVDEYAYETLVELS